MAATMRPLTLLALAALAGTAGCSRGSSGDTAATATMNEEQASQAEQRAPDRDKVMRDRWAALFAQPAKVIAAANEFDFAATPLQPANGHPAYRSTGKTWVKPQPGAPVEVTADFDAASAAPDRVDAVTFTFKVEKKGEPRTKQDMEAAKLPASVVRGFLSRFELYPGRQLVDALRNGSTATEETQGSRISVIAQPIDGLPLTQGKQLIVKISNTNGPVRAT